MQIKKILCGIAVCVLVASTCIGLAACKPNAKSIVGEQVDEEEWKSAFTYLTSNDAEFTVEYYAESSTAYSHKTMIHTTKWTGKGVASYTYVKDGSYEYKIGYTNYSFGGDKKSAENALGAKAGKTSVEKYSETLNGTTYVYEKNLNDEWEKSQAYSDILSGDFYFMFMTNRYSSYEYSKEHSGYVVKGYKDGDALTVYKFKDAKLVAVYYYAEGFEEESDAQEYSCTTTRAEYHVTIKYIRKAIDLPVVVKTNYLNSL